MSRSVLLIGGTGFVGSALRRAFAGDERFSVTYSSSKGDASNPRALAIDLLQPSSLAGVRSFDVVINLTGQVTPSMELCTSLNTTGIANLIAALDPERQILVQISTTQVYGTAKQADESSPLRPETPYAKAKASAESRVQQGLPADQVLIPRLCNLYGPGQTKGLPWYLTECIRNSRPIVIADHDGTLRRHFLHVDDAALILHDLVSHAVTGIVNVAGSECFSIREIIALCEGIVGRPLDVKYGSGSPHGNIDVLSTDKLSHLGSHHPTHRLEQYFRTQLL